MPLTAVRACGAENYRLKRKARRNACHAYSDNLPYTFCEQIGKEIRDISDEIPFEIPESWEWCRIGSIFTLQAGKNISANQIAENIAEGLYPCFGGNGIRGYVPSFNREGYYPIIGRQGALCGNINLANGQFYATEHAVCVETFANTDVLWCCYFLTALNLNQYATATAQPGLAVANINEVLIPLPPLSEQHRIVAKIEELLPYIEKYGKAEEHLTALNTTFPEALKKSILQEAVQGKLVPQNPDDEPASVLLERIRAEKQALIKAGKIKRDKHESVIITRDKIPYEIIDGKERCIADEVPFELPEGWCWCRLKNIVSLLGDGIHGTPEYSEIGEYHFINGNNLSEGKIIIKDDTKKVDESQYLKYKKELNETTVFVSINGTIGNIAFYNNEPVILGKSACYFNLIMKDYKAYIYWLLKTDYFLKYAITNATGSTIKNVSLKTMNDFFVPLPPLAEQHRIVAKIEEIMPMIERLTLR